MDQNPARAEYWMRGMDDQVGALVSRGKTEGGLSFREACNKIVHCNSINFDYVSDQPRRGMAMTPIVHLYGVKGKDEWRASVEINKLIRAASQLT
jgi:hypothetical protein